MDELQGGWIYRLDVSKKQRKRLMLRLVAATIGMRGEAPYGKHSDQNIRVPAEKGGLPQQVYRWIIPESILTLHQYDYRTHTWACGYRPSTMILSYTNVSENLSVSRKTYNLILKWNKKIGRRLRVKKVYHESKRIVLSGIWTILGSCWEEEVSQSERVCQNVVPIS